MRNYKRKTTRGNIPPDIMNRAATQVKNGEALRAVAKQFNIDRMTLTRFIKKTSEGSGVVTSYKAISLSKTILSEKMEEDLASHIKNLADIFHGLTLTKCCVLAYEFASANKLAMPPNWIKNGKAGEDWWSGFKKRHQLAVRKPEATSFSRATAFNWPMVNLFYNNLASAMDANNFQPADIYNCDETGCTTVQRPKEVVTSKGKKQVGALTSGERGELVTVVYTISAAGNALPPLFIFPRVNYRNHFINGAPPGSIGLATKSGWINENAFAEYIHHIIRHTRCSIEHKILLILDNHESHISIETVDLARKNGIVMLTIPPHTSHRLQPLDCSVYGPFKGAYNRAMDGWMRSHPGKTTTIYEIPGIVSEAHMASMTPRNIISGFASTGIYPYNRDLFNDDDYAPSSITDREVIDQPTANTHMPDEPTTSASLPRESVNNSPPNVSATTPMYVSPTDIYPFPKARPKKATKRRRKKGSSKILTSTPVRNEIAAASLIKKKKTTKKNKPPPKKVLFQEASLNEDENDVELDDESDISLEDENYMEGDFVVVKVSGRSSTKNFIARIDVIEEDEFEGFFLKRIASKTGSMKDATFFPDLEDEAAFFKNDIVAKLPEPKSVGGSARKNCQLCFMVDLSKFDINQ